MIDLAASRGIEASPSHPCSYPRKDKIHLSNSQDVGYHSTYGPCFLLSCASLV
jgi:hypothetical protein